MVVTSDYYWIFGYWSENSFVTVFTSTKARNFPRIPCSIINVSFHPGSKLFTTTPGFTMNCISDTDFCVSKKMKQKLITDDIT